MKSLEKTFNWFLILLVVSLVGNACADFAILWHCVNRIATNGLDASTSHYVTAFYCGQAIGAIFLAPVLAAWVDRHGRRFSSVLLDATYAVVLILMLVANYYGILNPILLFPFGAMTASLGALHRGAIGYGAVKVVSEQLGVTKLVAKFNAAIYTTNLIGSVVSGFLYHWVGLNGCLIVAIVTFVPMPFIYFKLFPKEVAATSPNATRPRIIDNLKAGARLIGGDRLLWVNSLAVSIWNVASNIFPGLVAIAFQKVYPGRTDYSSLAISFAILAGVFSFGPMEKFSRNLSLNKMMTYALSPAILALILCTVVPSPYMLTLAFTLHCMGAALVNISSGSLRVSKVPKEFIGRVNTAHSALVYVGQVVGSLVLVPIMATSISSGAAVIVMAYLISATAAATLFPSQRFSDVIGATR